MNDQNFGLGGSYLIDSVTGERRLVHRTTEASSAAPTPAIDAAPTQAPAQEPTQETLTAQAQTPVNPVAPADTTTTTTE